MMKSLVLIGAARGDRELAALFIHDAAQMVTGPMISPNSFPKIA
jgi:hypothetical protein